MEMIFKFNRDEEWDFPELRELHASAESGSLSYASAFQYLSNIDEYPEALGLAFNFVSEELGQFANEKQPAGLKEIITSLHKQQTETLRDDFSKERNPLHEKLAPLMSVSGFHLQNLSRVASAHTELGSKLFGMFAKTSVLYSYSANNHEINPEQLLDRLKLSGDIQKLLNNDREEIFYELPLLISAISQFPRELLPEILGFNLAWHCLGIQSFLENLFLGGYFPNANEEALISALKQRQEELEKNAVEIIEQCLSSSEEENRKQILSGINSGALLVAKKWENMLSVAVSICKDEGVQNYSQQMAEMIVRKAPCAIGYHRNKKLGGKNIDELLDIDNADINELLERLAESAHVSKGNPGESHLTNKLVEIGGPMANVFSSEELNLINNWISELGSDKQQPEVHTSVTESQLKRNFSIPSKAEFIKESETEYADRACSLREMYFKLVNIEYFPEILPLAEQFLQEKLLASLQSLEYGERAIPDLHYREQTLEKWVFDKHREQIDAYQPLKGEPDVSKEDFIRSTTSLAPLLLIDGAWLQGSTCPQILFTPLGKKLFRIFFEEIGEGDSKLHHANIYRELLASMDVNLPEVVDIEFAFSELFEDSAFEVPILWLALSCFSRHYFPELLGMNLAVELAGLGQNYMEAHDTLKYFGYPTTFVDFHNSSDNASVGHAAQSMEIIKEYLKEVLNREGPHSVDQQWQRVWVGMRLTLPSAGDFHWNPANKNSGHNINLNIYQKENSIFASKQNLYPVWKN